MVHRSYVVDDVSDVGMAVLGTGLEFDFQKVLEGALGALDLGAEDRLAAHIHGHEEVGIGNDLDEAVETAQRDVGLRKEREKIAVQGDRRIGRQRRWDEGPVASWLRDEAPETFPPVVPQALLATNCSGGLCVRVYSRLDRGVPASTGLPALKGSGLDEALRGFPQPFCGVPRWSPPWRGGRLSSGRMCRWLAYTGSPILLAEALYAPAHSLIDQSLHSSLGAEPTNGDGFGIGWYDPPGALGTSATTATTSDPNGATPGVFRSIEPAWNDRNLHELASHVASGHFFAHVRAAIGSPVQQTNCHPFRHDSWLWMHNGLIAQFATLKRDLALAIDPALYPQIEGGTDSEILFYLALSHGLADDPPRAVAQAIGLVEEIAARHGIADPFQGTLATTDGQRMWVFRYSSAHSSRSLFYTADIPTLRRLYPERRILQEVGADARLIVSEPIGELPGAWREVPESSCSIIAAGHDEIVPFSPIPPPGTSSAAPLPGVAASPLGALAPPPGGVTPPPRAVAPPNPPR